MTEFNLLRGRLIILVDLLEANQSVYPARELEALVQELEASLRPTGPRGSKGSPQYAFNPVERAQIRDAYHRLMTAVERRNADSQMILDALQDALSHWHAAS